jgi:K+-transporting ATPase ATPase B chain
VVELADQRHGRETVLDVLPDGATTIEFSATTRLSGVDLPDGRSLRKGAPDAVRRFAEERGGAVPAEIPDLVRRVAEGGATPVVVADGARVLGVIALSDQLKVGIRDRLLRLRAMGLRVVMVTGDNPVTARVIANEAGVDDFVAEAKPEDKLAYIRREQAGGRLVAMMGDGTNDAPALAQADIGVAMNSGTQAAKEAGNMVDLDSDPTKILEVVEIGKQLLMTRGALTTFSIANDVAKYFAIIPAMFMLAIPGLAALNVMGLTTPRSAILSALIFNALVIPALIPIALRGVRYRPIGADALLRRNLLIYGLGGVLTPFLGIWLIDRALALTGLA